MILMSSEDLLKSKWPMGHMMVPTELIEVPEFSEVEYDPDGEANQTLLRIMSYSGVIVPVEVRRARRCFILVDGRRRLWAAKLLGFTHVPARLIRRTWGRAG
jgi:ParB-like chromosome segregation protein Spo0J